MSKTTAQQIAKAAKTKAAAKVSAKTKSTSGSKTSASAKAKAPVAVKKAPAKKAVPAKKAAMVNKPAAKKAAPVKTTAGKTAAGKSAAGKPVAKVAKAPLKAPVKRAAQAAGSKPSSAAQTPAKPVAAKKAAVSVPQSTLSSPSEAKEKRSVTIPVARPVQSLAATAEIPSQTPPAVKPFFAVTPKPILSQPMPALSPAVKVDPKLANAWKNKTGRELSDAELMAMPEAEYMNDKQLDFFRGKLEQLKNDLLSNADETTEHLREDTTIVPDPADRATIEEEHALELRTRDRERKLLKKISQALTRIEAGEYGYCDETGEPIGLGRLIARPTATLTLEAQQRRELKQKLFGD